MEKIRTDSHQRRERTRKTAQAARVNKGHPLRDARRQRAAERLAAHVYDPERCGEECPKRG